jgi:hypothetical protein
MPSFFTTTMLVTLTRFTVRGRLRPDARGVRRCAPRLVFESGACDDSGARVAITPLSVNDSFDGCLLGRDSKTMALTSR